MPARYDEGRLATNRTNSTGKRRIDSTIPPPLKPAIFYNELFMAGRHKGGVLLKNSPHIFFIAKDYRTMTSGWQRAPFFRRYGREQVSKPAISL